MEEVKDAVNTLKNNKSQGSDGSRRVVQDAVETLTTRSNNREDPTNQQSLRTTDVCQISICPVNYT